MARSDGKEVKKIEKAAKKNKVAVVLGANIRGKNGNRYNVYNAILFINKHGKLVNVHYKTIASHTEKQFWASGNAGSIRSVKLQGLKVTGVSCWEARNPLTVAQIAFQAPDLVFLPTQDWVNKNNNGPYMIDSQYIARNSHSYVLASSVMFNWKNIKKYHPKLYKYWKSKNVSLMVTKKSLFPGGGIALSPYGDKIEEIQPSTIGMLQIEVDTNEIKRSLALHSITDSYRLEKDYTFYVDGKKITGIGPRRIY